MSALTGAIVVGAGAGRRFGGVEKAFFPLAGRPLLCYSVEVLEDTPEVDQICLVLAATSLERGAALVRESGWRKVAAIVPGGRERQDSVRGGLEALPQCEWILVHDAARPLLSTAMVQAGLRAAAVHGAAVAAIPVRDTLKRVEPPPQATSQTHGLVRDTVARSGLWAAQTPQVFRAGVLRAAFQAAGEQAGAYTDDASLVEATGHLVAVYPGSAENVKLTLPEDVTIVEALLAHRSPFASGASAASDGGRGESRGPRPRTSPESRVPNPVSAVDSGLTPGALIPRAGTGYDVHRLVPGRRLVLGGVTVPAEAGLAGHSDGDALVHAVIDALLGACALPDIGRQFPPGDPAYRDVDSMTLLARACELAHRAGWRAHNLDATVVCERPRLAPYLQAMRASLATALGLSESNVSVKAKTNEGLDAVGLGQAIAAHAIILIVGEAIA